MCQFKRLVCRKLSVSRPLVPLWDLLLVLDALSCRLFESYEVVELKMLSVTTALLMTLVTAKRVSDLQALSVHPSCLQLAPGQAKTCLRYNGAFVPKVVDSSYRCSTWEMLAFYPPPFLSEEDQCLHTLCTVQALSVYVQRTAGFRRTDQLFISWSTPHKGKPLSRQRLSHWIVEAISLAYSCKGAQSPVRVRAHSTRSMSSTWACEVKKPA